MNARCGHVVLWVALLSLCGASAQALEGDRGSGSAASVPEPALQAPSRGAPDAAAEAEPTRISMDFKDAELKNVLKTFSQQTGLNVIASEKVGDKPITLYLEDVTVLDALDRILEAADLRYERPVGSQIYVVRPKEPGKKSTESLVQTITRVYRLKYARVSTSRLARAAEALGSQTPFEAAQATNAAINASIGSGGGGSSGSGGTSGSSGAGGSTAGGTGTSGGAKEIGVDKVVAKLLTEDGTVVVDERTNSLIVTDIPENFPRIEAVLKALDIRTAQVLIEAEVLETTLGKVKDLGLEWGTGSEGTFATFTPGSRTTRFPFNVFGQKIQPSTTPTHFGLSTLDASSAVATLQALETDTDTKILARPKVLTLDNEAAVIRLSANQVIGFQTQTTSTGGGTASVTATPERTITGVILVVTPQVNEGGGITMLVEPSVTKTVTSNLTPPSGLGNSVLDPKTRSARAMVRIRAGETLVLGGLIDNSDEQTVRKVPVLSGIPIVGEAFKNKETTRTNSELIVFVTPRILHDRLPKAVASGVTPMLREQEPGGGSQQQAIEQTLNALEQEQSKK
ncbi:MAG: type II secretion system protein GspD [Candidatus Omnitrophica bacterium]|nr:type II secretion system protein GspD [Candidatus Omnitrophota bacterium]